MKQIILTSTILLIFTCFWSQTEHFVYKNIQGDSIKIEIIQEPTICDCINVEWRNKKQKKVCNLTYDYDFMSKEEQEEYDKQKYICEYPSICDCAHVSNKDKGLLKTCNSYYNYKRISKEQLDKHIKELENCPKKEKEKISICDCINVDNYQLKQECNDTFFNDSLVSEVQRKENLNTMKKCIEEQNYQLDVTACDCALNSNNDLEFKLICDEKIEKLKENKRKLTDYLYTLKVCKETDLLSQYISNKNITKSDLKYTICKCNENNLEKEVSTKCNQIWNYKKMTLTEQQAFTNAVARCD